MAEPKDYVELKVAEAHQSDIGKCIVRLDSRTRKELSVTAGDIVEVQGKNMTGAIVWQSYPQDEEMNLIRMDGLIRQNAGVGVGDLIKVRKSKQIKEAKKVVLAPPQAMNLSPEFIEYAKRRLINIPVAKGDSILVGVFGRPLIFKAATVKPVGLTQVTTATQITIQEEPVKELGGIPQVSYEDIGGIGDQLKRIREMIELPLRHPELFSKLGIEPPKGVLLYGPPGTGKTLLAQAVASESEANFTAIQGPEIVSKFVGEAEERLRQIFQKAAENSPSIIFIDEIDAIAPKREEAVGEVEKRIVAQLLTLMDGLKGRGKVVVIGATNRPNALDPALRRPGRFDREIELGVPDRKGRKEVLQIHTRGMPIEGSEKEREQLLDELAAITHGYVGADLAALCREAAMKTLRRILPKVNLEEEEIPIHILEALKITKKDFTEAYKEIQPTAMREVMIEVPNVKWDDVGGLDKVKKELQEAVEWPLKYPDMFKRMGIRPTRGIFIFGPPGCGKTLLAKAVATESEANFIAVKGPELFCISPQTPILTDNCGLRTVEEFYNKTAGISQLEHSDDKIEVRKLLQPVHTFGLGERNQLEKSRVLRIHKLFVNDAYDVEFSNACKLTASANQPLFAFKEELRWEKLGDIKEKDWVAVPSKIGAFAQKIALPCPNYKWLKLVNEDADFYYVKISTTKTITKLPKHLSAELAEFLGWFAAEGNISKEGVCICNSNAGNKIKIRKLFELFVNRNRIKEYPDKIIAYSTPLALFLNSIFEQEVRGKKSYKIKVPPKLFKTNRETISSFLRGAYLGDGHIAATKIEYASMSKNLVSGISYLLTILGIKHKVWQTKKSAHIITITGKKETSKFLFKIMCKKTKLKIRCEYNAQYLIPNISFLLKKVKQELKLHYDKELPDGSFEHAISGRRRVGLLRLQKIMKIFDKYASEEMQTSKVYKNLKIIASGDLAWIRVKSIQKAKPQWMYDIETDNSSFIGGELPLLLHNSKWVGESEKGVREIFRKARQAAPTIVFFDEIDAMAPKRGGDMGTHVMESVVNQMLTEMDGLEDLKEVVVIAATNRPELVDAALMRPGRFDRLVQIPAPDLATRKKIFEVHTKRVPLTKEINLDKLAEQTEGYSGADIEGIVREAAMNALREKKEAKIVELKHFKTAMEEIHPSLEDRVLKSYDKFKTKYAGAEFV